MRLPKFLRLEKQGTYACGHVASLWGSFSVETEGVTKEGDGQFLTWDHSCTQASQLLCFSCLVKKADFCLHCDAPLLPSAIAHRHSGEAQEVLTMFEVAKEAMDTGKMVTRKTNPLG